jgi:hypothetical protein
MPTLYDILTEAKAIEADARTLERRARALVTAIYNISARHLSESDDPPPGMRWRVLAVPIDD